MSPIRNYTDINSSKTYGGIAAVGKHRPKPSYQGIVNPMHDKQPLELPPIPTPYSMGNP
jgi:hypothetical protein